MQAHLSLLRPLQNLVQHVRAMEERESGSGRFNDPGDAGPDRLGEKEIGPTTSYDMGSPTNRPPLTVCFHRSAYQNPITPLLIRDLVTTRLNREHQMPGQPTTV